MQIDTHGLDLLLVLHASQPQHWDGVSGGICDNMASEGTNGWLWWGMRKWKKKNTDHGHDIQLQSWFYLFSMRIWTWFSLFSIWLRPACSGLVLGSNLGVSPCEELHGRRPTADWLVLLIKAWTMVRPKPPTGENQSQHLVFTVVAMKEFSFTESMIFLQFSVISTCIFTAVLVVDCLCGWRWAVD